MMNYPQYLTKLCKRYVTQSEKRECDYFFMDDPMKNKLKEISSLIT